MTKEEFYKIAQARPEMSEESVYRLTVYLRDEDDRYVKNDFGEWQLRLQTSPDAFYSGLEEAEKGLMEYRQFISRVETVHHAIIERIPLNCRPGAESIAWWLYDADGERIDSSVCSAFHCGDKKTPAGKYLGRLPEEIRFAKGDIVEVIGYDSANGDYVATLAIINCTPGNIDDEWQYFNRCQQEIGEYPFNGFYCLDYFHDYSDDQYGYLSGCGGDNALTESIVAPTMPVSDKIREEFTQLQKNHAEWLKCLKTYDLTPAESDMLQRGEITEEDIRTTRGMTE